MKRFYALLCMEFVAFLPVLCVLVGGMTVLETVLFGMALWRVEGGAPFAYLVDTSGIPIVFGVTFGLLLFLLNLNCVQNYWPSKNIYALLTLPVKRERVYGAKLMAAFLSGFCVVTAQLALILIALAAYRQIPVFDTQALSFRDDGKSAILYLALLDSRFLRLLVPPDVYSLAFSLSILIGAVCIELSVSALARAGRRAWVIVPSALWLLVVLVTFPLTGKSLWQSLLTLIALIMIPLSMSIRAVSAFKSGEAAS